MDVIWLLFLGLAAGALGGMLGIGGGLIDVPLLQRLCRLPLRQSIATRSAVICLTAIAGSVHKILTLSQLTGFDGRPLNATESLPLAWGRVAFILLLSWAGAEMSGVF